MIFQPVLHPLLLAPLVLGAGFLAVRALWRARGVRRIPWVLRLAALLAVGLLALRPGIAGGETETLTTDTDIVLLVDSTASIVAEDWGEGEPRLTGVRADVAAIIREYPGARFALITFDAAVELRLPLTTDTAALASALDVLTPEVTARSKGSSIGIANRVLVDELEKAAKSAPDRSRMVFYLGDGEQTAETPPESFREAAGLVDGGAVLGYGTTEGGRMRVQTGEVASGGGAFIPDGSGQPAVSKVDQAALETIASDLGVGFELRTADADPRLPEAPTSTTARSDGTTGDVTELGWILALLLVALLAADLLLVSAGVPAVLRLVRPADAARPGGDAEREGGVS